MSEYFRKPIVKTLMLKGQEGQSIKGIEKTGTDKLSQNFPAQTENDEQRPPFITFCAP